MFPRKLCTQNQISSAGSPLTVTSDHAQTRLPELSNCYCHPGRAGGSPFVLESSHKELPGKGRYTSCGRQGGQFRTYVGCLVETTATLAEKKMMYA